MRLIPDFVLPTSGLKENVYKTFGPKDRSVNVIDSPMSDFNGSLKVKDEQIQPRQDDLVKKPFVA